MRSPSLSRLPLAVTFLVAAAAPGLVRSQPAAAASASKQHRAEQHTIAVDVSRVLLNVSVKTKKGRPIPGLRAEDFVVFEDGERQSLLSFLATDRPLTLGFVVDNSRSMRTQQPHVVAGAVKLAMLSNPDDHVLALQFSDSYSGIGDAKQPLSHLELRKQLLSLAPDGMTSLYDGIVHALELADHGPHLRQALVVFSDGGDTASSATLDTLLDGLRRSNAIVYTIGLSQPNNPYRSPGVLRRIADVSGGAAFFPKSHQELMEVCERIAIEIRSQYTISYSPANPRREGAYRKIRVMVNSHAAPKAVVQTREGYFEPQ